MVCFTIYLQKAVRIIFIDKLSIQCHRLWQHRRHRGLLWCCIQWRHYSVDAWRHNSVDADAWRRQQGIARKTIGCIPSDLWSHLRKQRQKTTQVTWDPRRGQVTCQVTWLKIGDRKRNLASMDWAMTTARWGEKHFSFYPRPVLAFGYCRCLRVCVCACVCPSIISLSVQ